ncbi:DUF5672 family protein [Caballeronia novacaledonica]|uniref:DUF5672 family protein n=1 Tax=Caballeronia novacaledonica TaxID=1544861 RepID=UPI0015E63EC7|nr:DUF5672 family protein [Caballeronia novacaledonica]
MNPALAARALEISQSQILFGDTLLLTDQRIETRARIDLIPRIKSREEYSVFVMTQLLEHISTPWILLVQWDGFVANPSAWSEDFFSFDYIGARWPNHRDGMDVGNGGFTLRSRRLLQILATDERFTPHANQVEDELICRTYRPMLEAEYGIRFAPAHIADRFSAEFTTPCGPTFGFHGVFNMYRHVGDDDLIFFARNAQRGSVLTIDFIDLCLSCLKQGRASVANALYSTLRSFVSAKEIEETFRNEKIGATPDEAAKHIAALEALREAPARSQ